MSSPILHFVSPPIPYFIDCGRTFYNPGETHIRRNSIGVFDVIVVTKGTLGLGEGSQEWTIQQGEAFILRPDAVHYGTAPCTVETEIIWIHFNTFGAWDECSDMNTCLANQTALMERHKVNAYLNHSEVCSIFIPKHFRLKLKGFELLEDFFQLEQDPRSLRNWKRQNIFQLFIQHLDQELASTSDGTALQLADRIELFIRQNYTRKITNAHLQKELNYHPNYLAKCMLKVYGMTPIEYLVHYRLEQAKKLLIQSNWSIARITEEVGFQHTSYFSYCFGKQEGLSPLSYRKKLIGHR
ncbi:AraC family transcriptional regulator [Gorillibacterium massiliense]|uniref:AraC family transcriptional regulator n=1 Tax=Gorillibacterium massiliense TaxID=1280390 RepID=UPI0004AE0B01|nr:AraC family transcriptional regulator [Gorillibacterium massiliense]